MSEKEMGEWEEGNYEYGYWNGNGDWEYESPKSRRIRVRAGWLDTLSTFVGGVLLFMFAGLSISMCDPRTTCTMVTHPDGSTECAYKYRDRVMREREVNRR